MNKLNKYVKRLSVRAHRDGRVWFLFVIVIDFKVNFMILYKVIFER